MMRSFLLKKENDKNIVFWNLAGGALNAGQSALILVVLSRILEIDECGIFSLAYAVASLALTFGMFGVRNFQASDVREKYGFKDYVISRLITTLLMLFYIVYVAFKGLLFLDYSPYKCIVIGLVGLLKTVDAFEDVLHGRLQQRGRLDIAAKCILLRYILYFAAVAVTVVVTKNLIITFSVGLFVSITIFVITYLFYKELLSGDTKKESGRSFGILRDCFVIAFGSFSMIYIANAPKYAIDANMDETTQALFNYIFMPVYVVSALSTYVFQPVITRMAEHLKNNDKKKFIECFFKQTLIILLLGVFVLLAGFAVGIFFLNLLYKVELSSFKPTFMILLFSGCLLAFSSFLSVCIIVLRRQNFLIIGYFIPALIAFVLSDKMVVTYNVPGAGFLYFVTVAIQLIVFAIVFLISYKTYKTMNKHE